MKKYFVKLLAVLVFASVALSSCSATYRENHRHHDDHGHDHDHDDHHERNY